MASIKFPRKGFEKHIKLNKEVEEKISLFGTHLESLTENEIELEILPNRPDLFSLQGFLRAFKAFLGKEPGLKKYKVKDSGYKLIVEKSLPKEWPYAVACIVKNIKFDDAKIKEVIDMQEKLGATLCRKRKKGGIGLYPLEKISFPITFKGLSPDEINFRPLEYPNKITGRQILSKHPTGREYANIIEGWEKFPVFIDKKGNIMSMPPIINSHDLGKIDETTKNVFIEATGTNLNVINKAILIIATSLAEMGGEIYSIECIQQDKSKGKVPDLSPETMKISIENVNKLLGLSLKEKDIEKLLPRMSYDYSKGKVSIPAWRTDILHEVDIIEDIAIAYGYDKFIPELPNVATAGQETFESKTNAKISEILIGLGMQEISSYHLIKKEELSENNEKLELENSKTDFKYLRPNLLIPALRIFSENKDNEYPQKVFEIGTIFKNDKSNKSESGILEQTNLIIASSPSNFTEIKQSLDYLFKMLSLEYNIEEMENTNLAPGRAGSIIVNKKPIGFIGEVHPETLKIWNMKMPISLLEINLNEIYDLLR